MASANPHPPTLPGQRDFTGELPHTSPTTAYRNPTPGNELAEVARVTPAPHDSPAV